VQVGPPSDLYVFTDPPGAQVLPLSQPKKPESLYTTLFFYTIKIPLCLRKNENSQLLLKKGEQSLIKIMKMGIKRELSGG